MAENVFYISNFRRRWREMDSHASLFNGNTSCFIKISSNKFFTVQVNIKFRSKSTLYKMDTVRTSSKCPSHRVLNYCKMTKNRPTPGVRLIEVSVNRELTVLQNNETVRKKSHSLILEVHNTISGNACMVLDSLTKSLWLLRRRLKPLLQK